VSVSTTLRISEEFVSGASRPQLPTPFMLLSGLVRCSNPNMEVTCYSELAN
jgi:hypothetical protein